MTHMQPRLIADRIGHRRRGILLLGPRQVGKSTLCRSLNADLYVDLADQGEFLGFSKDPQRLRREVEALQPPARVVIDEVQRVPALLDTVQALIDRSGGKLQFVLTGSSARKLKRGGANLLPGRIILERMDPLCAAELDKPVDFGRALRLGMLPGIYLGDAEAEDVLGTYADVYLREEIAAEALTKNLGAYARFLDVIAATSGQWLNYSKLSSDAEIPKETVRRFVDLLDDTLLAVRLPPFRPPHHVSRRVLQRERVFLFDVGVRNALLGLHRHPVTQDQVGVVFEHWVILQVVYLNRAQRHGWRLSSYRSEAGAEVDLIVERDSDFLAIEIKAARSVSAVDTRGLQSLQSLLGTRGPLRKWIIYRGPRKQKFENGVEVWPVLEALRALTE
jgi:predicted AAA+ superfamily ATPase